MMNACELLLMRARARRAYCKKCRVHIGSTSSGWPNVPVFMRFHLHLESRAVRKIWLHYGGYTLRSLIEAPLITREVMPETYYLSVIMAADA
jgi:hypothetical protein